MQSKHTMHGITLATLLVLTSTAHAGLLGGGLGGQLGGGFGNGLGGMNGAGALSSQGAFNGSLNTPSARPVSTVAHKAGTTADTAKDATKTAADQAKGTVGSAASSGIRPTAAGSSGAPSTMQPAGATAPTRTATLSGNGSGSLEADHSPGSTSLTSSATGNVSGTSGTRN
jgi:hypothetical protein